MILKTDYDGLPDIVAIDDNVPNNKDAQHLYLILMSDNVVKNLENCKFDIIKYIPELSETFDYDQNNPHHHLDLWYHTINALGYSENNFEIRVALLLHDISKPKCCVKDEKGISHYPGHNAKSAEMARDILTRLAWNENFINNVCDIIEVHDKEMTREFALNNFELAKKILQVQICDIIAHNPKHNNKRQEYMQHAIAMISDIEKTKK